MIYYIVSSFAWFLCAVLVHIALSKMRLILGFSISGVLGAFVVGLVGCIITTVWLLHWTLSSNPLPLTGVSLYVFCSLAYLSIAGAPMLGDESPTTKILIGLRNKGSLTKRQILSLFTYDEVIGKRINALCRDRWIQKKGNAFIVTPKGKYFASFFMAYRRLLGLSIGG